jgi:teichuronic acid exporter
MYNAQSIKHKVMSSLAWLGAFKFLSQLITWSITIFVMRILRPEDYGLMALAAVFTTFFILINELGLGAALVQRQDVSKSILQGVLGLLIIINASFFLSWCYQRRR